MSVPVSLLAIKILIGLLRHNLYSTVEESKGAAVQLFLSVQSRGVNDFIE